VHARLDGGGSLLLQVQLSRDRRKSYVQNLADSARKMKKRNMLSPEMQGRSVVPDMVVRNLVVAYLHR
jgi:hypothetical protein